MTIGRTPQLDRRVRVMSFLQIAISAGGLAVLVLVLVEGAGLLRRVRRCPVDKKRRWKEAIDALKRATTHRRRSRKGATGGVIVGKELDVGNEWKTVRDAGRAVRGAVMDQADELSKKRKEKIDAGTGRLKRLRNRLHGATLTVVEQRGVMAIASSLLFMVLASIHILYYSYFDFNVMEYLPGYSLPAIMLSLLQVLVLLLLASLFLIFAIVVASPWAVLQLARICYGIRAAAAKALASSFFTLCHYSMTCGRLASLLLDDTPAASARKPAAPTKSVSSAVSRTIRRLSPRQKKTDGAEADSRGGIVDPAMSLLLLFLFACACAVFIWFEPQYRAYATCYGAHSTRVVIDPPLGNAADFTKIGQIGEHVFLVPFGACGRSVPATPVPTDPKDRNDGTGGLAQVLDGYRYVIDSIRDRMRFLRDIISGRRNEPLKQSDDVTVVPVNRVLCMYEYEKDAVDNSEVGSVQGCQAGGSGTTEQQATLLPVHLLLHFRNAQLSEPNGDLSGSGVDLEPLHKRMLTATVNTLRRCANQENPVRIRPYGFASSKPFAGRDDTNDLNVMAANRRARAVYKALNENGRLDGSHVNVEEPPRWDTFAAMVKERDACIESPSGERGRDPFFDRVVVLDLQTPGRCAPADWAARTIRCSGSEGAGP